MDIYNGSVECGRVSSLIVRSADLTDFVEVGWYESPTGVYTCVAETIELPKQLGFASLDGMSSCEEDGFPIQEGTDSFRIDDENENGIWVAAHKADLFWASPNMGSFSNGLIRNNGERMTMGNVSNAEFDGLERMRGQDLQWVNWVNTFLSIDDDSGAKGCFYSNTHTAVKQNSATC